MYVLIFCGRTVLFSSSIFSCCLSDMIVMHDVASLVRVHLFLGDKCRLSSTVVAFSWDTFIWNILSELLRNLFLFCKVSYVLVLYSKQVTDHHVYTLH